MLKAIIYRPNNKPLSSHVSTNLFIFTTAVASIKNFIFYYAVDSLWHTVNGCDCSPVPTSPFPNLKTRRSAIYKRGLAVTPFWPAVFNKFTVSMLRRHVASRYSAYFPFFFIKTLKRDYDCHNPSILYDFFVHSNHYGSPMRTRSRFLLIWGSKLCIDCGKPSSESSCCFVHCCNFFFLLRPFPASSLSIFFFSNSHCTPS